jgi:hypothetical protein
MRNIMSLNLNPEQRRAHAHAYRNVHHTRLYRLRTRADGGVVLVVKFEHPDHTGPIPCVGKVILHGNTVIVESFDAGVSPHYRDADHLEACVTATLNAYAHPGRPVAEAFDILNLDEPCSTSLPMVIPEMLTSAH